MAGIFGPETIDAVAKMLAGEHMQDDASIRQVFLVRNPNEVRLIEVTSSVPANGEVLPFRFAETPPDVPFKSLVVLIHPEDWNRRSTLQWPDELNPSRNTVDQIAGEELGGDRS